MPLSKRKIEQLKRFENSSEKQKRLQRKHTNLSKNYKKYGTFVTRILFNGKIRLIKFATREDLQKHNLESLISKHSQLKTKKQIDTKGYEFETAPHIHAERQIGIMRDYGNVSTKQLLKHFQFLRAERRPPQNEVIEQFIKKNKITSKDVNVISRMYGNLNLVASKFNLELDNIIGDNVLITGFNSKTRTFKLGLIDQIKPDRILQKKD